MGGGSGRLPFGNKTFARSTRNIDKLVVKGTKIELLNSRSRACFKPVYSFQLKKYAKMCFAFCCNRLNKTLHSDEPQFLAYLDFTIFFIVYKENPFITVSKTIALCPPPSILPSLSRDLRNLSPVAEVRLKVLELIIGGCCPRSIFTRSCHEMQSPVCWSH